MPRVSAPLVLLPAWLVMVACSPHSLRIGKCSLAKGTLPSGDLVYPMGALKYQGSGCALPESGRPDDSGSGGGDGGSPLADSYDVRCY